MGGTPTQKQTQQSLGSATTTGYGPQQGNIDLLMKGAADFYNSGGPQYYGGQTYAGPTTGELLSRNMANRYATGAGQDFVGNLQAGENFWLNPENIFNPSNIPGMDAAKAGIKRDVTRNLTESILPEMRGGGVAGGTLGGSRQEIGEGLAAARTGEQIADAFAGMDMNAYSQGLNMYNSAAGRAPQTFNLGLAPSEILGATGAMERADQQQAIDANMAKFNWEQMAPYFNLEMLQQLIGSVGQYGSNITTDESATSKTNQSGGGMNQALGLAMAAMSMYSHSSLKDNIVPATGFLEKLQQLQLFRWQYKGDSTRHVGPMAEDFQQVFGVGDGVTLNIFDLLGVLLGSVRELSLKGA